MGVAVTAAGLGIEFTALNANGFYRWLVASFLIGKRIRSSVAVEAYRMLVHEYGLDTPAKLANCSHGSLVRILRRAGYARYDESTARRLRLLATGLDEALATRVEAIRSGATDTIELGKWLLSFEGIGPKTLEIFMREAGPVLQS
jgi:endonuclease III